MADAPPDAPVDTPASVQPDPPAPAPADTPAVPAGPADTPVLPARAEDISAEISAAARTVQVSPSPEPKSAFRDGKGTAKRSRWALRNQHAGNEFVTPGMGESPGPAKYAPTVSKTGNTGLGDAPSCSFHGAKKGMLEEIQALSISPGPQYDPVQLCPQGGGFLGDAPSYSFGSRSQAVKKSTNVPGPGSYNGLSCFGPQSSGRGENGRTSPAFSFGSSQRLGHERRSQSPSPGEYEFKVLLPTGGGQLGDSPAFKFGTQLKMPPPKVTGVPGPGSYQAKSSLGVQADASRESVPTFSFPHTGHIPLCAPNNRESKPGPGAYSHASTLKKGGVAFEQDARFAAQRTPTAQMLKRGEKELRPGPGAYSAPSCLGPQPSSRCSTAPTVTIGGKAERLEKVVKGALGNASPGPLYQPLCTPTGQQYWHDSPKFRFGTGARLAKQKDRGAPGPGQYTTGEGCFGPQIVAQRATSPAFSFVSKEQLVSGAPVKAAHDQRPRTAAMPGPGQYDAPTLIGTGKAVSVPHGPQLAKVRDQRFPGPGAYAAQSQIGSMVESHKQSPASFSFPKSPCAGQKQPARYFDKRTAASDQSAFGKNSPGPGRYESGISGFGHQALGNRATSPGFSF